jgi:hypothetical protein
MKYNQGFSRIERDENLNRRSATRCPVESMYRGLKSTATFMSPLRGGGTIAYRRTPALSA